ncbi:MAG: hypothetical protein EPN41_10420 [Candidimonas sp.]|nr:MAG: hypothetical protein EPN41_10420 [Candidimonas sp.]
MPSPAVSVQSLPIVETPCPCRRLDARGAANYFFGYYNKTVWDRAGRYLLAHRAPFRDALLTPALAVDVGFFDLARDTYHAVDTTRAWNWQMGCQLQWLDGLPGRQIIYNVRVDNGAHGAGAFASRVRNLDTGATRDLPLPVYVVSADSRYALCVDYGRLYITHQTIGYPPRPARLPAAPDDDGIRRLDIASGRHELVLSYGDLFRFHHLQSMDNAIHWVSHMEISPSSRRVVLLHRWTERVEDETCFLHRLITMDPDGGNLRLLECSDHPLPQLGRGFDPATVGTFDYEKSPWQISHPSWRDDEHIVVWGPHGGAIHYQLYRDSDAGDVQAIAPAALAENGHMTFSPVDSRWLLSDTYPDSVTHVRALFLFDVERNVRYDIGHFRADPHLSKENRCDLHPRWSRDGRSVCVDSMHESGRHMYVLDVSKVVA